MFKKLIILFLLLIMPSMAFTAGEKAILDNAKIALSKANSDFNTLENTLNNVKTNSENEANEYDILRVKFDDPASALTGEETTRFVNLGGITGFNGGSANVSAAQRAVDDYKNNQLKDAQDAVDRATVKYAASPESEGDLFSAGFKLKVDDFSPGMKVHSQDTKKNANFLLGTIIQKFMIALGSISVLIMTIGTGYMILYSGQDDLLSKGKTIFTSGIIAMVVALSSYYIISIFRFILYKN